MKKSCKRKVRDPFACINSRMGLVKSQAVDIGVAYHSALAALSTPHANEQAWSTLACALNVGLLLAERGIVPEALPMIKLAQEGLMAIKHRADNTCEWGLNIAHHRKQAIYAAINFHDEQCATATKVQLSQALRDVHSRVISEDVFV